jgi:hypothetical protein
MPKFPNEVLKPGPHLFQWGELRDDKDFYHLRPQPWPNTPETKLATLDAREERRVIQEMSQGLFDELLS